MSAGYLQVWKRANRAKVAEYARRYRARHPDKVKVIKDRYRSSKITEIREKDAEAQRRRREADPEGQRRRYARWNAKKELRLTEIAGRPRAAQCEICDTEGKTVFDHCHATERFRGWICDRCNKMLGLVKDNPELLRKLASYLDGKTDDKGEKLTSFEFFWDAEESEISHGK